MKVLLQDFESAIENNQLLLAEKLYETGLMISGTKTDCGTCEYCNTKHIGDKLFHLFGYYNNHYISVFTHYLCILDVLKKLTK